MRVDSGSEFPTKEIHPLRIRRQGYSEIYGHDICGHQDPDPRRVVEAAMAAQIFPTRTWRGGTTRTSGCIKQINLSPDIRKPPSKRVVRGRQSYKKCRRTGRRFCRGDTSDVGCVDETHARLDCTPTDHRMPTIGPFRKWPIVLARPTRKTSLPSNWRPVVFYGLFTLRFLELRHEVVVTRGPCMKRNDLRFVTNLTRHAHPAVSTVEPM